MGIIFTSNLEKLNSLKEDLVKENRELLETKEKFKKEIRKYSDRYYIKPGKQERSLLKNMQEKKDRVKNLLENVKNDIREQIKEKKANLTTIKKTYNQNETIKKTVEQEEKDETETQIFEFYLYIIRKF